MQRLHRSLIATSLCIVLTACGARTNGPPPDAPDEAVGRSARPAAVDLGGRAGWQRRIAGPVSSGARLFDVPRSAPETMRIHFINVGQGDATLFEFPCGAILVDSGGETQGSFRSNDLLKAYLDEFFARRADLDRRLDAVVFSHPHVDHTRASAILQQNYEITHYFDNTQTSGSGSSQQNAMRAFAQSSAGTAYTGVRSRDIELDVGDDEADIPTLPPLFPIPECDAGSLRPELTPLAGHSGAPSGELAKANNNSVVLRIDFGDASALLTGDLERHGIDALVDKYSESDLLDVGVLQVGHHGSHNATTVLLVELISPELAVFSAGDPERREGQFNAFRFGHPNHKAIRMLDDPHKGVHCNRGPVDVPVGIKGAFRERPPIWETWSLESALFNTGWDGTVIVEAHSDGRLDVSTERQGSGTGFACP